MIQYFAVKCAGRQFSKSVEMELALGADSQLEQYSVVSFPGTWQRALCAERRGPPTQAITQHIIPWRLGMILCMLIMSNNLRVRALLRQLRHWILSTSRSAGAVCVHVCMYMCT